MSVSESYPNGLSSHAGELRLDGSMSAEACKAALFSAVIEGNIAWKTPTRSHSAIVGNFNSFKMRRTFRHASNVEANVLILADVLQNVLAYQPQALTVTFFHDGAFRKAIPDLAVVDIDGQPELWECKSNDKLADEKVKRLSSLRYALRSVGIDYRAKQPSWSCQQPLKRNAKLLWAHADHPLPNGILAAAERALDMGRTTVSDLIKDLKIDRRGVFALVAHGVFAMDIGTAPFGPASRVYKPIPGASSGAFELTK